MAQIVQKITVEVAKPNLFQAIVAKQGDSKSRFLEVTLVDNEQVININPTSSVTINAKRPDGLSKRFEGEANVGDTVTVPLAAWILEQPGIVFCDISVINTTDQRVLTSTSFRINVEEAACAERDITDDENYDVLIKLIEEVEEITKAKENGEFNGEKGEKGEAGNITINGLETAGALGFKDGVLRTTFGEETGEMVDSFEEIFKCAISLNRY